MALLTIQIRDALETRGRIGWGEVIGRARCFPCHRAQLDILGSRIKYTAAFFGTGCGKTAIVPIWLYLKMNDFRRAGQRGLWRGLIVSPTQPSFESSQLKQHLLGAFDETVYAGRWNEHARIYRGSAFEIVVRTAETDYRRISGGQYNAIAVDEAFQISNAEVWDEVRRRSNILDAPVLVVSTPNADGWLFSGLMQPFLAGDPQYYVRQAHTRENPAKTPEQHARFLDAELIKLGKAKFDRMYGGLFTQLTGLVYEWMSDDKSPDYPVIATVDGLPAAAVRAFGGLDWGYNPDPFAAHVFVHCADDVIYVVDEIHETKLLTDLIGHKLRDWMNQWSLQQDLQYIVNGGFFDRYYCDSSRPESADMVKQFGVPISNRRVALIDAGISVVDQMFRTRRLKIFDRCVNLIRELRAYSWDAKGRPVGHSGDHCCDSLRYAISSYMQNRQITLLRTETKPEPIEVKTVRLRLAASPEDLVAKTAEYEAKRAREHQESLMNWEPGG